MPDAVRHPAVSGLFYEADAGALRTEVSGYLAAASRPPLPPDGWRALLLPHAGHVYSGAVAGRGAGAVEWPRLVLLLGPNHQGEGATLSLSPASSWRTPLGDVPVSRTLSEALLAEWPALRPDVRAHRAEHALEVILPFLQVARPGVEAAFVSVGDPDLGRCVEAGEAIARAVSRVEGGGDRVALVVSSDLNHYLPRSRNREKDLRAVDALLGGAPRELYERVLLRERISMCGVLPATALLSALQHLPPTRPRLLAQGDSGDAFGDVGRVVGYASVLWESIPEAPQLETT